MIKKTHKGLLSPFAGSTKHKHKYTCDQIKDMRDRRLEGESYESIARSYNVTRGTIHKLIQRHDPIIINERLPNNSYIHVTQYCELHSLNYNTVMYHIRTKGIKTKKFNNKVYIHIDIEIKNNKFISDDKIDMICKLSKEGLNTTKIAEKLKLNRATVRYYSSSI